MEYALKVLWDTVAILLIVSIAVVAGDVTTTGKDRVSYLLFIAILLLL